MEISNKNLKEIRDAVLAWPSNGSISETTAKIIFLFVLHAEFERASYRQLAREIEVLIGDGDFGISDATGEKLIIIIDCLLDLDNK